MDDRLDRTLCGPESMDKTPSGVTRATWNALNRSPKCGLTLRIVSHFAFAGYAAQANKGLVWRPYLCDVLTKLFKE
jgi:hypothetical protein